MLITLSGSGSSYTLIFEFPKDRRGAFIVSPTGAALKNNGNSDTLSGTPKVFAFDTREPKVAFFDTPAEIPKDAEYDYVFGMNVSITGLGIDDFIREGINPGTPKLYRSTYFGPPSGLPAHPVPFADGQTDWVEDSTGDSTEAAQYFLLRFPEPSADGDFELAIGGEVITIGGEALTIGADSAVDVETGELNVYLKDKVVRGPDGQSESPIANIPTLALTQNVAFSQAYKFASTVITTLTSQTGLPTGLTASLSGDTITLAGTPTTLGSGTGTIRLTNANGFTDVTFTWRVEVAQGQGLSGQGGRAQAAPVITFPATPDPQAIQKKVAFTYDVTITGSPTTVKVSGILKEKWGYDWNAANNRCRIYGTPAILKNGIFHVEATNASGTTKASKAWKVVDPKPVIAGPSAVTLYKGQNIQVFFPYTNTVGAVNIDGLHIGLVQDINTGEKRAEVTGRISTTDKLTVSADTWTVEMGNSGGDTTKTVNCTLSSATPAAMPAITATAGNAQIVVTLPTLPTNAISFGLEIKKSTEKNWVDIGDVGTGTYTILGLENGVTYNVRGRVNSPWIGTHGTAANVFVGGFVMVATQTQITFVNIYNKTTGSSLAIEKTLNFSSDSRARGITYIGNNKVAVIHDTAGADTIVTYSISGSSGSILTAEKTFTTQAGVWTNGNGIAYIGNNKVVVVDYTNASLRKQSVAVYDISGSSGNITPEKSFFLGDDYLKLRGITKVADDKVAIYDESRNRIAVYDISVSSGSTLLPEKYFQLPAIISGSLWRLPNGITKVSEKEVAIADYNSNRLGILDISGPTKTFQNIDTYFNLTSSSNPRGLAFSLVNPL